jgi:hypothetical protein
MVECPFPLDKKGELEGLIVFFDSQQVIVLQPPDTNDRAIGGGAMNA